MNKSHFTLTRKIGLQVSLSVEMFSVSCLEANCFFFLVVLSFLYLFFYQHLTAENPGKVGPGLV